VSTLLMVESWVHSGGRALPPLLTRLGHDYVLLTRDPGTYRGAGGDAPVLRDADEVVVAETNDPAALAAAAAEVARRRPIDGVLTTCDYYLGAAAAVARRLGLPGEDPAVLRAATRKDRVRAALAAAGVPDVAHGVAGTWDDARKLASDLGYPLVAKPVDLNAGTGVRRVVDEEELAAAFAAATGGSRNSRGQRRAGVLLLEQVLVGQEVSVETVTWRGGTTVLAVTDKSLTAAPASVERHCDVAVIGGSAVGLAAALQLARQRRTVLVVDDGTPRNAPGSATPGRWGDPTQASTGWAPKITGCGGLRTIRASSVMRNPPQTAIMA
jgi:argininosuccinate lyase